MRCDWASLCSQQMLAEAVAIGGGGSNILFLSWIPPLTSRDMHEQYATVTGEQKCQKRRSRAHACSNLMLTMLIKQHQLPFPRIRRNRLSLSQWSCTISRCLAPLHASGPRSRWFGACSLRRKWSVCTATPTHKIGQGTEIKFSTSLKSQTEKTQIYGM
jgi:hypothetical protein